MSGPKINAKNLLTPAALRSGKPKRGPLARDSLKRQSGRKTHNGLVAGRNPDIPTTTMPTIRVDGPLMLDFHADHQDRWSQRARPFIRTTSSSHTSWTSTTNRARHQRSFARDLPRSFSAFGHRWIDCRRRLPTFPLPHSRHCHSQHPHPRRTKSPHLRHSR
jgi:hypothetical protein